MRIQNPLGVLTPTLDAEVLGTLAGTHAAFTVGGLNLLIPDRSEPGLRKVLRRLVGEGIVLDQMVGRTHTYLLNRDHLAAEPIIALAQMESTLAERMRAEIDEWPQQPVYAAIFGAAARGEMTTDSDIDIFFVQPDAGDVDEFEAQVQGLCRAVTSWTGNNALPLVYRESEIQGARGTEPILRSIKTDGRPLAGSLSQFTRAMSGNPAP